jgi:hypothetical protein
MAGAASATLEWRSDDEFEIDGIVYACRPIHDFFESTPERFCLRKPRHLVERLERRIRETDAGRIVELGIFEGGSTGFIAQALGPEKLVCFDLEPPNDALGAMLEAKGLEDVVRPHWETDQADGPRLRSIIAEELGGEPIDLVIDDASHLLEPTRASFNTLFPLLRPGGTYLVEDWAWAHGITNAWPHHSPLSIFVFELVLANAHRPEAVARLEIDRDWVLVTRGPRELDETFDLLEHCGERGRAVLPPPNAGVDPSKAPAQARRRHQRRSVRSLASGLRRGKGGRDVG